MTQLFIALLSLPSHPRLEKPPTKVVNDALAARFAEKLTQMRGDVGQLVTPSLVFHGAPSQEPGWNSAEQWDKASKGIGQLWLNWLKLSKRHDNSWN